ASVRDLCDQFSDRNPSIAVEFTGSAPRREIPREVASCLYRVAQEALENVAKHANAKDVSVTLCWETSSVLLSIKDDGTGFDPAIVRGRGRLGLIGMQERARL